MKIINSMVEFIRDIYVKRKLIMALSYNDFKKKY